MEKKVFFIFLGLILVFSGGCRALRDKFIRQREEKEAPVYMALRDYPAEPTRQVYLDYYLYARGWLAELMQALQRGISHKRQRRAISEALMNVEQIISFFNQEGKDAIGSLHQELKEVKAEIEKIPNLSQIRRNALVRRVQRIKRDFSSNYTYSNAAAWLD